LLVLLLMVVMVCRPYFAEILNELDEILVEISIKEEPAQEIWKALKTKVRSEQRECELATSPLTLALFSLLPFPYFRRSLWVSTTRSS
jgi:hypothetical protein